MARLLVMITVNVLFGNNKLNIKAMAPFWCMTVPLGAEGEGGMDVKISIG